MLLMIICDWCHLSEQNNNVSLLGGNQSLKYNLMCWTKCLSEISMMNCYIQILKTQSSVFVLPFRPQYKYNRWVCVKNVFVYKLSCRLEIPVSRSVYYKDNVIIECTSKVCVLLDYSGYSISSYNIMMHLA